MENLKKNKNNQSLKDCLDTVLRVSEQKFSYEKKADSSRLGWGRLIVHCVKTYSELLKNEELEQLRKEVDELKEIVGQKVIM